MSPDHDWLSAWMPASRRAVTAAALCDLDHLPEALSATGRAAAAWLDADARRPAIDPAALATECVDFCRPLARPGLGTVKLAYVSTRPDIVVRVLFGLVCVHLLACLHRVRMPSGWLVFPAALVDADRFRLIRGIFAASGSADDDGSAVGLTEPAAGEPAARDPARCALLVGGSCGLDLAALRAGQPPVAERIGLPVGVVPSRRVAATEVTAAPWRATLTSGM